MLAFAYTYFMRVPAVNKALHENVRGCSTQQSTNTRSSKNFEERSF